MSKRQTKLISQPKSTRKHRVSFLLNDEEYHAVERYLSKHSVSNKSKWYRSTVMTFIFKAMEEEHPTLFDESEMKGRTKPVRSP
ncbi:MAG: hypothetical protein LBT78_02000 [Tannerella sp.]|jgi:hypothetical protein|nr:hypothetical protein [Tannerella sp.]